MKVLIAYASRHGATAGIAQRIAKTIEARGHEVACRHVSDVGLVDGYDAFVVGSSAYMGRWEKEAAEFVRRNRAVLASHPAWLFSSGPIGTELVDKRGRDVLEASVPREFAEFADVIRPRGERVFFGAYDPDAEPVGLVERFGGIFTRMPAIRAAMPVGDFRDWPAIEAWSEGIAAELVRETLATAAPA